MTLTSTTTRNEYLGTGITGPYAYGFRIFAATDLLVTTRDADTDAETTLSYPSGYTVSGVGNRSGGSITLATALATGDTLVIRRVLALTQTTSIRNQGPFHANTHEDVFDRLVMIDQQQQDEIERSIRLPETIDPAVVSAELPALEAGKLLAINGDADGFTYADATAFESVGMLTPLDSDDIVATDKVFGFDTSAGGNRAVLANAFARAMRRLDDTTGIKRSIWKYATAGVIDDDAIQDAVDACDAGDTIEFGRVQVSYDTTIHVRTQCVTFEFSGFHQAGLTYTGTGSGIELGDDDGLNWDAGNYNGTGGGFAYLCGYLKGPNSAGTYAIRDWRGGNVRIERAFLQGWDYWFWGVQSDINRFSDLVLSDNDSGCYLGARSDQATFDHLWTFDNGRVFHFEGSSGHTVRRWFTDSDGTASVNPVLIRNASPTTNARYGATRVWGGIVFDTPWLESLGTGSLDVEAWFECGTGDTTRGGSLVIRDPLVITNTYSTVGVNHVLYMVKADNCSAVWVERIHGLPGGAPWTNQQAVFKVANAGVSTNVPDLYFSDGDSLGAGRVVENYSTTACKLHYITGTETLGYSNNSVGGTGGVSQFGGSSFRRILTGTASWNPGSVAAGAQTTTTVAVTLADMGMPVFVGFNLDLQGMQLTGYVSAAGTVTVVLQNGTAGAIDLAAGTLRADAVAH